MSKRPNILLILSDQQRWDTICNRTGCHTPHINALAEQGMSFERSYTPVSVCCPARAMLASGAYPWHNGVLNQVHVPERTRAGMYEGTVTYAQRLRDAGYQTGYAGKFHADWLKGPLDYGYARQTAPLGLSPEVKARGNFRPEDLHEHYAPARERRIAARRDIRRPGGAHFGAWWELDGPLEGSDSYFIADRAAALMREFAEKDEPWLLEAHFTAPHDVFHPHVEFARRYNPDEVELPASWHDTFENKPRMNRREAAIYDEMTEYDVRNSIAHYWAFCEELDWNIGRLLDVLRETGQMDDTLIVFSSDHGEMLGDHHMFIKGWMPYEGTHRVPMVARLPGVIPAGASAPQLVQLHDLAHTFRDIGGAEPLPYADGVSLVPLLRDPGVPSRDAILNVYYGGEYLYTQRILITQRDKYVFNGFDIDELYDLERDPHELTNQIDNPTWAERRTELQCRLYEAMDHFGDPYASRADHHGGRYLSHPDEQPLKDSMAGRSSRPS